MKFKNIVKLIVTGIFFYLGVNQALAASLYITPASASLNVGNTGSITVYVNTEGKKVFGSDMFITITGDAMNFTTISAAGDIDSDEVDSSIEDAQLVIRVSSFDVDIEGTKPLVTISYQAIANGTTTLAFRTGGNFDTSLVAESETANDILTSTQGTTFTVGNGGSNITEVCGNGTLEGSEQCEPNVSACATGYSCSASCVCNYIGGGVTVTPVISGTYTPNITYTPIVSYPPGGGNPVTIYPTLPGTALKTEDMRIFIVSGGLAFIGLALFALFSLPEFNLELLGTQLKVKFAMSNKNKIDSEKEKFERGMVD